MKALVATTLILLISVCNLFSQDVNLIKTGETISRGKVILKDGQSVKFKDLSFNGKTFSYRDVRNGEEVGKEINDVYKVYKTKTFALLGGAAGGLAGVLIPLSLSAELIESEMDSGEEYDDLSAVEWLVPTFIGIGVGALIGSLIHYQRIYYENNSIVNIYPAVVHVQGNYAAGLTLRINLR